MWSIEGGGGSGVTQMLMGEGDSKCSLDHLSFIVWRGEEQQWSLIWILEEINTATRNIRPLHVKRFWGVGENIYLAGGINIGLNIGLNIRLNIVLNIGFQYWVQYWISILGWILGWILGSVFGLILGFNNRFNIVFKNGFNIGVQDQYWF